MNVWESGVSKRRRTLTFRLCYAVFVVLTGKKLYVKINGNLQKSEDFKMQAKKTIRSYFIMTFGTLMMACGIYFFKFPNNFSTGGVSALSILLAPIFPQFTPGQFMMFFNVVLLALGLLVFGREFTFKTVYCTVLLSAFTRVFEIALPMSEPFTEQKFLELIFAIIFTAGGSAILFNEGASSGGTDIVAMILQKYTKLNIGKALLCSDFLLAAAAVVIFDAETGFLSVFGLIMKAFIVDDVIDSINLSKCFIIVTDKEEEICKFIHTQLHRGATVADARGSFTSKEKKMIITVLSRPQAVRLKQYIKQVDEKAFSIITSSSDILGKGFRTVI